MKHNGDSSSKLYARFVEHAFHSPEKKAIVCGENCINYQDLEAFSSLLAHSMTQRGLQPGQRVAIYLDKSIETVICMLAILKAGGIYVPIDPSQPYSRANYILANCGISAIAISKGKASVVDKELQFPQTVALVMWIETVCKNKEDFFYMETRSPNTSAVPNNDDLVFILYTSGSTGVPKGVKISRRNAQVFIDWCLEEMALRSSDIFLNLAGFHFDLSVFDIYVSLSVGGTLVIYHDSMINPKRICQLIEQHQVTVTYSVPSLLTLLVSSGAFAMANLDSLRYVLFAGEVFPIKYLRELKQRLPNSCFYNLYGPTETNVCSYFKVEEIPSERREPVPIGSAVSGSYLYACNGAGNVITEGEIGELYVSGPCVTPGYWNYEDPRNHKNHQEGIHATGDLVSLENGLFVFRGRKDNQVKFQGYRIELDEIEHVLVNHEKVRECAVLMLFDRENPNLVAFVAGEPELYSLMLKEYCSRFLPKYMIPQVFYICKQLAKNSNGKIDKGKLQKMWRLETV